MKAYASELAKLEIEDLESWIYEVRELILGGDYSIVRDECGKALTIDLDALHEEVPQKFGYEAAMTQLIVSGDKSAIERIYNEACYELLILLVQDYNIGA